MISPPPAVIGITWLIVDDRIAASAIVTPMAYAVTPKSVQTRKYAAAIAHTSALTCVSRRKQRARRYKRSNGNDDGSIIATIIAAHIPTNIVAAPSRLWPGIRIHVISIDQPPGITIAPPIVRADHSVSAAASRKTTSAAP